MVQATLAALAFALAVPAAAATLVPGDLVVVGFRNLEYIWTVWKLDPATMDTTRISTAGLVDQVGRAVVHSNGTIYLASRNNGVIAITPETGAQSVLVSTADLGGRSPEGLATAPDGGLYITAGSGGAGTIFHRHAATGMLQVVSAGGLLSRPTCLAVASDGTLYVGERELSASPTPREYTYGSIVRVDPSGAQTLIAGADEAGWLFFGPKDIAIAPDGSLLSVQYGVGGNRNALVVRTQIADGASEVIPQSPHHAGGMAFVPNGDVFLGGCEFGTGPDCLTYKTFRYPDGSPLLLWAWAIAVAPSSLTPTYRGSWGELKTRYR